MIVRFLVRTDVANAGLHVGPLYGAIAARAVAACLIVELWWVPCLWRMRRSGMIPNYAASP